MFPSWLDLLDDDSKQMLIEKVKKFATIVFKRYVSRY